VGFIVVGLDGSATSRHAFTEAVREAEWRGSSILAVHVVTRPVMTGYEFGPYLEALLESGQEFAKKEVQALQSEYEDGFPVPVGTRSQMQ
jgi:nucleotide-binding universal stress UspA family protein